MATRSALTTLINTNLQSGTSITATEHRQVEQAIVDSTVPYNRGYVTLGNLPITVGTYTVSGDLASAVCSTSASTGILCTLNNTMPSTNYLVRSYVQSLGTIGSDSTVGVPVYSIVSTTQFRFSITEISGVAQNIRVWFEIISLD